MSANMFFFVFGAVMLVVGLIVWRASRVAAQRLLLSNPVLARSSHARPTSRAGGIIFITIILLAIVGLWQIGDLVVDPRWYHLLLLSGAAALMGFVDDVAGLAVWIKLAGQVIIAGLMVMLVGSVNSLSLPLLGEAELLPAVSFVLSLLWIVGFANAFNFMDGLNGMAAGVGLVAGLALALGAIFMGHIVLAIIGLVLAAGLYGFLPVNVGSKEDPGIFMGDAGSLGLGYLLGGVALAGQNISQGSPLPIYFIPLMFLPFLVDVALTMGGRLLRGEAVYRPHKQHLYQILQQAGWSHGRVSFFYGLAVTLCAAAAMALLRLSPSLHWVLVVGLGVVVVGTMILVKRRLEVDKGVDPKTRG